MTPIQRGDNFGDKIVNLMYFSLYNPGYRTGKVEDEFIVMIIEEGTTKIVNFINFGTGVLVLKGNHISLFIIC